jgi:hypothetical protein
MDVEGKTAAISSYPDDLLVCMAWSADRRVGALVGRVLKNRLVIDDLLVALAFRRQEVRRPLVQLAIQESSVSAVAVELNREQMASPALFKALSFHRTLSMTTMSRRSAPHGDTTAATPGLTFVVPHDICMRSFAVLAIEVELTGRGCHSLTGAPL